MKLSARLNTINGLQIFQATRFAGLLLTGILLAKSGIGLHIIGNYEKLLLVAGAISFFWIQGILNSLLSSYFDHTEKKVYLFNVFVLISLFSLLIFGLMKLFSNQLQHLFSDDYLPGYRWICLFVLFNSPCFLIETIYLLKKKTSSLIAYGITSALLSIAAVVVPLLLGYSIETALAWLVLWAIIRFFWLLRLLLKNTIPDFRFPMVQQHLFLAWPLIISYLIGGSADYIDGLMATHFFGPDVFAVFRYGAREFPLSILMANALSTSMIPILRESPMINNKLGALKNHSASLMNLIYPASIVLMLGSSWIYPRLFDQRFSESAAIFNIYLLLAVSRMVFPQSIALALKVNKIVLKIAFIEILVNVIASYLLMLKWGIIGIAWGTVIAYTIEKILLCIYLQQKHQIKIREYIPLARWTIYSILLLTSYLIISYFN